MRNLLIFTFIFGFHFLSHATRSSDPVDFSDPSRSVGSSPPLGGLPPAPIPFGGESPAAPPITAPLPPAPRVIPSPPPPPPSVAAPAPPSAPVPSSAPPISPSMAPSAASGVQVQSDRSCGELLSKSKAIVAKYQASGVTPTLAATQNLVQNGGTVNMLPAIQNQQAATTQVSSELLGLLAELKMATSECSEACEQLAQEAAQYEQMALSQVPQDVASAQQWGEMKQKYGADRQSCEEIQAQDGGEGGAQLSDLLSLLPVLAQLALMMGQGQGDSASADATKTSHEQCLELAREKEANDSLNQVYADLCSNLNDTSAVSLGTEGGVPSAGISSSRLGSLEDRGGGFDQGFQGGLEKEPQSARVNTPSGGGGSASLGSGQGVSLAGGSGPGGRKKEKLNTDILKGTSGGGVSSGGSGGGYSGGGRGYGGYGQRNAENSNDGKNLKQYLPGGKKYRGPASAATKRGEVSAALGPSNFDKITKRYKKVQPSMLP